MIPENPQQYVERKMKEIVDTIETAKNANAVVNLEILDTVLTTPTGNTPVIICKVIINEQIFKTWKDKK